MTELAGPSCNFCKAPTIVVINYILYNINGNDDDYDDDDNNNGGSSSKLCYIK